jgi:hypothetical protein
MASSALLAKDGAFRTESLEPGRYLVWLEGGARTKDPDSAWGIAPRVLDLNTSLEGLELVARPTRELRLVPDEAAVGLRYRIFATGELPCAHGRFHDGAARTHRLVPGSYRVELLRDRAAAGSLEARLEDEDLALEVGP